MLWSESSLYGWSPKEWCDPEEWRRWNLLAEIRMEQTPLWTTELSLNKISRIPPDLWENWQNLTQPEAPPCTLWDAIVGDNRLCCVLQECPECWKLPVGLCQAFWNPLESWMCKPNGLSPCGYCIIRICTVVGAVIQKQQFENRNPELNSVYQEWNVWQSLFFFLEGKNKTSSWKPWEDCLL